MIVSSFLDVLKYGVHEYDFVNERETVAMVLNELFAHLQRLQRTFPSSSSYLSLQMLHILHSLLMDDMVWSYIDTQSVNKLLRLIDIDGIQCDECCLFRIFDIMSRMMDHLQSNASSSLDTQIQAIVDKILYLSYVYLQNEITATTQTVHYIHDEQRMTMNIRLRSGYTRAVEDTMMCRNIADITHIPSTYPFETVFCFKLELKYNNANPPLVLTTVISSNPMQFELLYDAYSGEEVCSVITTSMQYEAIKAEYQYPVCLYWDLHDRDTEWRHNNSRCWLSDYNESVAYCSCHTSMSGSVWILSLEWQQDEPLHTAQQSITAEHFEVAEFNANNIFKVYPIPLYVVSCLALMMITCMILMPDRSNIPLWIEREYVNDKDTFINDEMGAIYTIYQVYGFQRCSNLFALNLKNNCFLSEFFCRSHGTNVTSSERILLFYLYTITVTAANTYLYSLHKYTYFDPFNLSLYYPFVVVSVLVMAPVLILKCTLKQIVPMSVSQKISNWNQTHKSHEKKENNETLNRIYSQIMTTSKYMDPEQRADDEDDSHSYNSDDTPKLNDLRSPSLIFAEENTKSMRDNVLELTPRDDNSNTFRICVEELKFDPEYQWILDPKRSRESPAQSIMVQQFSFSPKEEDDEVKEYDAGIMVKGTRHDPNNEYNFLWFTSICFNSIQLAEAESQITRSTLDKILHLLPARYRDCIYSICNVDNEAFIVFEEYIEFIDAILLATGQWRQMYSDIHELEFDFRDMMDVFEERMMNVTLDFIFEGDKNNNKYTDVNSNNNQLSIDGALEIIAKLRGVNNKYVSNDIAVPLLAGFTKKAMTHCLTFCSRIFWRILTDEWWDYDEDDPEQQNHTNILYHLTHTSFGELFPPPQEMNDDEDNTEGGTTTASKRHRNSSLSSSGSNSSSSSSPSSSFSSSGHDTNTCGTLQSESLPFSSESSASASAVFEVEIDHMEIPTVSSMNAPVPLPMLIMNDETIKQETTTEEMEDIDVNNNYGYYKQILMAKRYYKLHFKWRKYVHFVMLLCILYASIITVIYGVHLDFRHYFMETQLESMCSEHSSRGGVIRYHSALEIPTASSDLTAQWLYCLLIQLLLYVFMFQPIVIALSTLIQHQSYKERPLQYKMDQPFDTHNVNDLISFFVRKR